MTSADPPPIAPTGDEAADDELLLLRSTTQAIHAAQEEVNALSVERQRLVLSLRGRGIKFGTIADAVPTTQQTIFKIHREGQLAAERDRVAEAGEQVEPS